MHSGISGTPTPIGRGWNGWPARMLLGLSILLVLAGCDAVVLHSVPEEKANGAVMDLQEQGVAARKKLINPEKNLWEVTVGKEENGRALRILRDLNGLGGEEPGFDSIFGKGGMIVTPTEERAREMAVLQGELARTIESLPGVINARVHLVLPERDLAGGVRNHSSAGVLVQYRTTPQGGTPISETEVEELVAHAVPGLRSDDVRVLLKPTTVAATTGPANSFEPISFFGIVMEQSSLPRFKLFVATAFLFVAVLGGLLFLSGRSNEELRNRAGQLERQLSAARRLPRTTPPRATLGTGGTSAVSSTGTGVAAVHDGSTGQVARR